MVARTAAEPEVQDVTPTEDAPPAAVPVISADDRELTQEWRPQPGEVFPGSDQSLRAILGRSFQNAERGLAEYDPVTKTHVWWRPNGRGGHTPVLRAVEETLKAAQEAGADFWDYGRNCWIWDGVKPAADPATTSGV